MGGHTLNFNSCEMDAGAGALINRKFGASSASELARGLGGRRTGAGFNFEAEAAIIVTTNCFLRILR